MAQRMDGGQFDADTLQLLAVVSRFEKKARRETIKEKPTAAVETPTENPDPASGDGDGASLTCAEATDKIAITKANKKAFNMLTCAIPGKKEKRRIGQHFIGRRRGSGAWGLVCRSRRGTANVHITANK
ncbi:hypothetical protein V6N12_053324 [Hibiscus sabdariffa]|uniref:Uncharacterized protein n=1 Tax=Hibiscus sabdariffa TaxID=183260 RepID=A0ABR2D822_9ROSI